MTFRHYIVAGFILLFAQGAVGQYAKQKPITWPVFTHDSLYAAPSRGMRVYPRRSPAEMARQQVRDSLNERYKDSLIHYTNRHEYYGFTVQMREYFYYCWKCGALCLWKIDPDDITYNTQTGEPNITIRFYCPDATFWSFFGAFPHTNGIGFSEKSAELLARWVPVNPDTTGRTK